MSPSPMLLEVLILKQDNALQILALTGNWMKQGPPKYLLCSPTAYMESLWVNAILLHQQMREVMDKATSMIRQH